MHGDGSALDRQIRTTIDLIYPSMSMLVSQDHRVGARQLYHQQQFVDVTRAYFLAMMATQTQSPTDRDRKILLATIAEFVTYIRSLFPQHKRGILTPVRQQFGRSLTELYKNTLTLQKLLEARISDEDSELGLLVLPEQQSSPIYTKIENDRIILDSGHSLHPLLRKEAIGRTRDYLQKELSELDATLRDSNIDRKYVETFARLGILIKFEDDAGAIAFGLHAKLLSNLTAKIENELADVLNVRISSTLTHAAYFASQYKDWIDFVQNSQSYPSRDAIDSEIDKALAEVETRLLNSSDTVDERIPQTLQFVRNILSGTAEDRKQAIYAGVRGVENLCITAITYSYDQAKRLIQDSAKKARPALVGLGAAAIIIIALNVISDFMPVIRNAPELNWILENLPKIEKIGKILTK